MQTAQNQTREAQQELDKLRQELAEAEQRMCARDDLPRVAMPAPDYSSPFTKANLSSFLQIKMPGDGKETPGRQKREGDQGVAAGTQSLSLSVQG